MGLFSAQNHAEKGLTRMSARITAEPRWEPDLNLLVHARMGVCRAVDLDGPDRAWVVAGLSALGLTADEIADRLKCSLRLVRQIKAEPMTIVATYALGVQDKLDRARLLITRQREEHQRELRRAAAQLARCRWQRDQYIDKQHADKRRTAH